MPPKQKSVLTQQDTGSLKYMGRDMIRVTLSETGLAVGDISVIWARGPWRVKKVRGRVIEVTVGSWENLEHIGEVQVHFGGASVRLVSDVDGVRTWERRVLDSDILP